MTAGIAGVFDRSSGSYETVGPPFFDHFGALLVDALDARAGERVVDVAAGTGSIALPALRAVGRAGQLRAVDLAPGMVWQLRSRLRQTGHPDARAEIGDAARLALPDGWADVVTCGFGVFFLSDPVAAVAEWRRVLRPGGRLGLSTWAAVDIPVMTRLEQELATLGVPPRPRRESFSSPHAVRQLCAAGGFPTKATVDSSALEVRLAGTDELLAWMWSHGGRMRLEHLDATGLRRLAAAVASWGDGAISMRWTALLATVAA